MRHAHLTAITTIVLASTVLGGCGFLKSLVGKNSVDLSEAQMQKMDVGLRKQDPTVCPREKIQMVVMADVLLKGDKQAKKLETYTGGAEANKNDKMEFSDFTFASNLGQFDKYGFLTPNPDVLASTDKEFEIVTAYKREPSKFNVTSKYKPSYNCIKDAGTGGTPGTDGQDGSSGGAGSAGAYGGTDNVGGRGAAGGPGNPGASGTDGSNGPNVVAYATIVKTPFYDKLVAIKITATSKTSSSFRWINPSRFARTAALVEQAAQVATAETAARAELALPAATAETAVKVAKAVSADVADKAAESS